MLDELVAVHPAVMSKDERAAAVSMTQPVALSRPHISILRRNALGWSTARGVCVAHLFLGIATR
ncbi:hypothetical protein [Microlunatus sagamiharensis]|uniref:hypothetical protein n=1 Tax=Microlunatus sagamiharensis TaxID=546874 RepID=UPI000B83BDD1|nr:hypothetical protein [Microlunatus sagamiharensis]